MKYELLISVEVLEFIERLPRRVRFGIKEWREIVNSEGDFEAIGFPMETDKPLEGFDMTWR